MNKVVGSRKMHSLLFFPLNEDYLMEAVLLWRSEETLEDKLRGGFGLSRKA